ncbi:MAG TPA: DEAD/DEAH box helicase family protein, partial [Marmoricola sp.]
VGKPAVVFSPNTAVQEQWADTWNLYGDTTAGRTRDLTAHFTSLTYQSLAVFEGDDDADSDGPPARGETLERLHPNGRALVEALRNQGDITIVLDECHHLLEVWGTLLRDVLDQLPDARVLGLTATPPTVMTRSQAKLTQELFGEVLYEARIPALVKEGTLAPYAQLAWVVAPTPDEAAWLGEQSERFTELTSDLFAPDFGTTPLPMWLTQRFVDPLTSGTTSWTEIVHRTPELAEAVLRFAHAGLVALPPGATLHEQHRHPPSAEDWIEVLDDWLEHCVQPSAETHPTDAHVLEAVRRTLPSIGYVLTRRGIRSGPGTVDRVTARSAAKQQAVVTICADEQRALGEEARIVVLCDHEQATATSHRRLTDDSAPDPAGSARGVLTALLGDDAGTTLAPLLVTGRTVAGDDATLDALIASVAVSDPDLAASLRVIDGTITGPWTSGQWVRHATAFFTSGGCRALIGTRGLLGEGWDAPSISTLIDLTTATTQTSVVQIRGRALRIDPAAPDKVALIWTVVCVFEGHPAGGNDWDRFVRKQRGFFTMDETGQVVDGVAGIDSAFSPFAPPPTADNDAIDARMTVRAEDRDTVRDAWLRVPAYADVVRHVVRVIPDPSTHAPAEVLDDKAGLVPYDTRIAVPASAHVAATAPVIAGLVLAVILGTALANAAPALLVLVGAGIGAYLLGRARLRALSRQRVTLPLVAAAIADGLKESGRTHDGSEALDVTPRPDGSLAITLRTDEAGSALFAQAFDEATSPMTQPRYVISRGVTTAPGLAIGRCLAAAVRPRADLEVWHTVPSALADRADHVAAFAAAWRRWVGPARTLYAHSPEGTGVVAVTTGQDPFSVTCLIRSVWQ